jgi:hypothetical protein
MQIIRFKNSSEAWFNYSKLGLEFQEENDSEVQLVELFKTLL